MDKHECAPENALKMLDWIKTRGGVAVWRSANLSNPGASWSTPVFSKEGVLLGKPSWEANSTPERIITDPGDIVVVTRKEVRRLHVALRMGSQGFYIKLTDASVRRLRAACEKAGPGAAHYFDHDTQEAVITMPTERVGLVEFCEHVVQASPRSAE